MILKEILERYSVRKYKKDDVSDDLIKEVIEAARLAPSATSR
jgi:nitroreductase